MTKEEYLNYLREVQSKIKELVHRTFSDLPKFDITWDTWEVIKKIK